MCVCAYLVSRLLRNSFTFCVLFKGNMRVLRRTISEQQPPLIPHIGSCLTLLVYHEDQPLMDPRGHMINFSRFHGTAGLVEVSDDVI